MATTATPGGYHQPPANGDTATEVPGTNPDEAKIPTAPKEPQRVIRSAPAVTEEEAVKKDEGVIDLDAK